MTQRSFKVPARVFTRMGAYYAVCWGILAFLVHGVFPFAIAAVLALAGYTTIPLFIFLRGGGWAFYPTAVFRLFVIRPLLYTTLL
jgi:hypothetical protein